MRWEYKAEFAPDGTLEALLDAFGKQGWEAWAINHHKFGVTVYFKRSYQIRGSIEEGKQ